MERIITVIVIIITITMGSLIWAESIFPPSMVMIRFKSIDKDGSLVITCSWGEYRKEVTIFPNESIVEIPFDVVNIRSDVYITIDGDGRISLQASPTRGYVVREFSINLENIDIVELRIREVVTIVDVAFMISPPASELQRFIIGNEDVTNYTIDRYENMSVVRLERVFVDPQKPLFLEIAWYGGRYAAAMTLYHEEELKIDGIVEGSINTFKVIAIPSLQLMEFSIAFNPYPSSQTTLKELKRVEVVYSVYNVSREMQVQPLVTSSISVTTKPVQTTTVFTTQTSIPSIIERIANSFKKYGEAILIYIALIMFTASLVALIFKSIKILFIVLSLGISALVMAISLMVMLYG